MNYLKCITSPRRLLNYSHQRLILNGNFSQSRISVSSIGGERGMDGRHCFSGETETELGDWLSSKGVAVNTWGEAPGTKTLELLLNEVKEGESALCTDEETGRARRSVSVINVRIVDARGRELVEVAQILPSGARRERNTVLAEKMLPGENICDAAKRGILEELGTILGDSPEVSIDEASHVVSEESRDSQSYPGLRTVYLLHRVDAKVPGCPETNFFTNENRADGLLKHIWEWR